jgi:hypothetical protein
MHFNYAKLGLGFLQTTAIHVCVVLTLLGLAKTVYIRHA